MITIKVDEVNKKLKDAFSPLSSEETNKAISRAINRTLERGRNKHLKNALMDQYVLTSPDVKNNLTIFRANKNNPEGTINASRSPISITHFKPRFEFNTNEGKGVLSIVRKKGQVIKTESSRKGMAKKGVSIEITKGDRTVLPFAFMIRGDGPKPVFARGEYKGGFGFVQRHTRVNKTGPDTPIQKIFTASVSGMANNKDVKRRTMIDLTPEYEKRLLHEINFLTRKIKD